MMMLSVSRAGRPYILGMFATLQGSGKYANTKYTIKCARKSAKSKNIFLTCVTALCGAFFENSQDVYKPSVGIEKPMWAEG